MRVLVTGAGGYVGGAVVAALVTAGHEPVALVHRARPVLPSGIEVRAGDLLSPDTLRAAVTGVDAVCHLAGVTRVRESWDHPTRYFQINAAGTLALLEAMDSVGVRRLVFASTAAIYGASEQQPMSEDLPDDPPHPYAASKAAAEAMITWQVRTGRLGAAVLRMFNIAGAGDPDTTRIIPQVLAAAADEAHAVEVNGDGSAVRDFLHVADAAEAFVAALNHCPDVGNLRRYNIGTGVGVSVADIIAAAQRSTGRRIRVIHRPAAREQQVLISDPSRARSELHWKPCASELNAILADAWAMCSRIPGSDDVTRDI